MSESVAPTGARHAYELLAEAATAVHSSPDISRTLVWLTEAARGLTGATSAVYVQLEGDGTTIGAGVGFAAEAQAALATFLRSVPEGEHAVRLDDVGVEGEHASTSHLIVPVRHGDGQLHGGLVLGHTDPDRFDDEEVAAVVALAVHLGVAIDNRARVTRLAELEREQREAVHQLQDAVRPPVPAVPETELGVHYVPADPTSPTGGDLYDWLVLSDGSLHLVVVDVMGKGVAATKDALAVTHALRMLALDGCPLDRLMVRADALLTAQSPELVATVLAARYDPSSGEVRLVGAGHPPAIVVCADGTARQVPAPGIPIGWPGAGSGGVVRLTLSRADTLVLYTDGLIEATKDILEGLDSLQFAATETARYPAPHMARALVERALEGADRRDDSLAVVLRRRTPPTVSVTPGLGPLEYRFSPNPATVPLARNFLRDWLRHQGVDDQEAADLMLMTSELCANAVRHATGAPGSVALRAWAEGDAVVIEVEDDGGHYIDRPALVQAETPDPTAERGRGLFLVEALSDAVEAHTEPGRTIVRATRRGMFSR